MTVRDTLPRFLLCFLSSSLISIVSASPKDTANTLEQAQMVDSGSWYSRVKWPHDGKPYESQNFQVFSDAASEEARRSVAEIAEDVLQELTRRFGVDGEASFRYPPGQSKIHIYAYKNRYPKSWGARAYYPGFVIWSLDHEHRPHDLDSYRKTIKHELVHVLELLLRGRDVIDMTVETMVHVWFSEGFGEVVTGGTVGRVVRDLGYMNHLTDKYGRICPVSIVHDGMAGDWSTEEKAAASAAAGSEYYYPMYRLAVEYLVDPDGHGRSIEDIVGVSRDIGAGLDFKTAFENRMGFTVKEYEARFFDLMNEYLDEGESAVVRWVSIVWLFLVAGSLLACLWLALRDNNVQWRQKLIWLMATALFGPLGLLAYRLGNSPGGQTTKNWRSVIASSVKEVTRNVGLFVLTSAAVIPFAELAATPGPEDFVFLFVLAWLAGYAALAFALSRGWYQSAARTTFLGEAISMVLAIAGLFIVFVPLSAYWWSDFDPRSVFFWGLIPVAAILGAILVYLYRVRLNGRSSPLS